MIDTLRMYMREYAKLETLELGLKKKLAEKVKEANRLDKQLQDVYAKREQLIVEAESDVYSAAKDDYKKGVYE